MRTNDTPFAVVTGVSRRVGFALAEHCAAAGFDLLVTAPDDCVDAAAAGLRSHGGLVEAVRADLGDPDGVDELCDIVRVLGRPVDALLIGPAPPAATAANAGGPGAAASFFDQAPGAVADALDLSVLAPARLAQRIGRDMRRRGAGRILLACAPPPASADAASGDFVTTFAANSFLAGFALALREALGSSGVTVTCLPPQPRCAGLAHGRDARARAIARQGFEAMMRGDPGLSGALAAGVAAAGGAVFPPPAMPGDIKVS